MHAPAAAACRAEELCSKAEGEMALLRQRLAQADGAAKAKERELERQAKAVEQSRSGDSEVQAKVRACAVRRVWQSGRLSVIIGCLGKAARISARC